RGLDAPGRREPRGGLASPPADTVGLIGGRMDAAYRADRERVPRRPDVAADASLARYGHLLGSGACRGSFGDGPRERRLAARRAGTDTGRHLALRGGAPAESEVRAHPQRARGRALQARAPR